MAEIENIVNKYFDKSITDRERAIFETGIALGFAYHKFLGLPFKRKFSEIIKKAIEASILSQPYRIEAEVKFDLKEEENHPYSYNETEKNNFEVKIKVKYKNVVVTGKLKYIPELNYPLMYIESIEQF